MKKSLIILSLAMPALFFAQKSGQIIFKESIKLEIELNEENAELMKNIPTTQTYDKVLTYSENESSYVNLGEVKDIEASHDSDGASMNFVIKAPESKVYTNNKEDLYINAQEFFGRQFLIKDKIKKYDWKISGEQKKVLDFVCNKAEATTEEGIVTAWFTPQIPSKFGPIGIAGLPGMVLALEQDGGKRTFVASKVDFKDIDESAIEKPSKGKVVSREEFQKIRDEKLKEMGVKDGKGGAVKMIIREERE